MSYQVPYTFVLKALYPIRPTIRKMLGGYGLSINKKLVLLLRDSNINMQYNGVYVAALPEFYTELLEEIQVNKTDVDIDGSKNSWLFISEDLIGFEQKVELACSLIKSEDERIGKIQ
ncbi:MAG: hypothetical protein KF781_02800 [Chitinophagaceae bacterium]|nr:hypothetical protein [Chitinophagaceae bacterium]MCW5904439.1 hypothetical protein [Chitinophagaceae bacterium]